MTNREKAPQNACANTKEHVSFVESDSGSMASPLEVEIVPILDYAIFSLSLGFLWKMTVDAVPGGVAGKLLADSCLLGSSEFENESDSGFQIFLGHLAVRFVPIGEPAWRFALLNAIISAFTTLVFFKAVRERTKSDSVAVAAAVAFVCQPFNVLVSTNANPLAIFSLLSALILLLAGRMLQDEKKFFSSCLAIFIFGLGAASSQGTFFIFTNFILMLWILHQSQRPLVSMVAGFVGFGFPLIAMILFGGRPFESSPANFKAAVGLSLLTFSVGFWKGLYAFCGFPFAILFDILRRRSIQGWTLEISVAFSFAFFLIALLQFPNLVLKSLGEDAEWKRFTVAPSLLFLSLSASGLNLIVSRVPKLVAYLIVAVLVSTLLYLNPTRPTAVPSVQLVQEWSQATLVALPPHAVFLTFTELTTNSLLYSQHCLKMRPDVIIVDIAKMRESRSVGRLVADKGLPDDPWKFNNAFKCYNGTSTNETLALADFPKIFKSLNRTVFGENFISSDVGNSQGWTYQPFALNIFKFKKIGKKSQMLNSKSVEWAQEASRSYEKFEEVWKKVGLFEKWGDLVKRRYLLDQFMTAKYLVDVKRFDATPAFPQIVYEGLKLLYKLRTLDPTLEPHSMVQNIAHGCEQMRTSVDPKDPAYLEWHHHTARAYRTLLKFPQSESIPWIKNAKDFIATHDQHFPNAKHEVL